MKAIKGVGKRSFDELINSRSSGGNLRPMSTRNIKRLLKKGKNPMESSNFAGKTK